MTKEEKQLISIEVDKYFRGTKFNADWLASHQCMSIVSRDDDFKPQSLSNINIDQNSVRVVANEVCEFSGSAEATFSDNASNVRTMASVDFGGQATTKTECGRTIVIDVVLTRFHRNSDILQSKSDV